MDKYKVKSIILITGILTIAVFSWRITKVPSVMVMVVFILAARNVNFDKIIKCYFNVNFLMILLISLYAVAGVIKNLAYSRQGIYRFSLGVDYPTDYAAYIFYLLLAYTYLNYRRLKTAHYIVFIAISISLYFITNARLDVISILLIIPVVLISKRAENKANRISRIVASNYWSLSVILPYVYFLFTYYFNEASKWFVKLNTLLSGRLAYGHKALEIYPIKLISQHVKEQGWGGIAGAAVFHGDQSKYFFIDSSYIRLLVIYGLVLTAFFVIVSVTISLRETIKHSYLLPSIILLMTVSCLIDQHLMEITFNPFLLAFLANTTSETKIIKQGVKHGKTE
ncbi:MAG TPA: polymerase [Limosilactobacillus oris]|uniref:polymerase n=1 Tax=Limosilactobacillus oris TaxID=1632 RepID=UPI001DA8734F|nr:polymerase [Limosilactobacillus oris]HJF47533.1 polymerase [Limosilactobacillus oris]